jgi:ABC-type Mn2+/Zn2+ transport system ATPase subunit
MASILCDATECVAYSILWGALGAGVLLAFLLWLSTRQAAPLLRRAVVAEPSRTAVLQGTRSFEALRYPSAARSAPPSKQVTLPEPLHEFSWEGLSYSAGALQVLRPSSGCIRPGLWAMIGPSGAGKSTLLGLLAGRKERGTSAGAVRLNGRRASARARRERIGYVTQDDVLPATSTVAEHLHFHAALRLPWLGGEARVQLVRHTMEALQLSKCADRLIGDGNGGYVRGLSGGERRRVSVATELMALAVGATSMLLLDEPLTGLDSANAALLSSALVALCPTSHTQTAPRSSHAHAAHAICDSESECAVSGSAAINDLDGLRDGAAAHSTPLLLASPPTLSADVTAPGPTRCDLGPTRCPTILMTVHQPTYRFLESLSGVVVLDKGGVLLYCGPRYAPAAPLHTLSTHSHAGPSDRDAALPSDAAADATADAWLGRSSATGAAPGSCCLCAHFDGDGLELARYSSHPAEAILEALADGSAQVRERLARLATSQQVAPSWAMRAGADMDDGRAGRWGCARARGVSMCTELRWLCTRQARHSLRHPLLLWLQLGVTALMAVGAGMVFYRLDYTLGRGVLPRLALAFFVGLYFLLTSLAPLPLWHSERLQFFNERAAGCYGATSYVLARTIFEGLLQRLLPALLCASIVYPMAGLSAAGPSGPAHAALFAVALCLLNLVAAAGVACLGIVCPSSALSTLVAVAGLLGAILFSGFVLNLPTLAKRAGAPPSAHPSLDGLLPAALPRYLSPLYYWHELLLSDELLQTTVHVHADTPGIKKPYDIGGEEVLMHLGYALNCSRLFGEPTMPCAYDLWAPAAAVAGLTALAVLLLAGCVRDPH